MPASGPDIHSISSSATSALPRDEKDIAGQYVLVDVSTRVAKNVPDAPDASLFQSFGNQARRKRGAGITIGIGDTIQITIFESAKGGLFIPEDAGSRPGNFVTLPPQVVDRSGSVKVPHAGPIRVAGRYVADIQSDIERRLAQKAIEPQAVINILTQRASEVAVIGDVNSANKLAVNHGGDRVLDMISRAGGIKSQGFETYVTVQRGGRSATVYFPTLVTNPQENIFIYPGDTILVSRDQRIFSLFGAVTQNGRFPFDRENIVLSEAVAKGSGLLDARADPSHVYVYRVEPRRLLELLGVDLSQFPPAMQSIPTIYQSDLRDPAGFFASQKFKIRNNDVIYVGNADTVEVLKFFNTLNAVVAPVASGASAGYNFRRIGQ